MKNKCLSLLTALLALFLLSGCATTTYINPDGSQVRQTSVNEDAVAMGCTAAACIGIFAILADSPGPCPPPHHYHCPPPRHPYY